MTHVQSEIDSAPYDATMSVGVGIVVVSHSRALADAAVALASEMLQGAPVTIEVAAGLDDTTFGTDAVDIKEAIERVNGPAGAVVLMDLGSAVLSAELALDLLDDPSSRDRVTLSPAPIVEGLIVAVVAAAGGASREEIAAEAQAALLGKSGHLVLPVVDEAAVVTPPDGDEDETVAVFTVTNPHGLHARPAARLVTQVRASGASIRLRNLTTGAGPVPATSLSRVATLAALQGHQVEIRASGGAATHAVEQLLDLAARRFDEPESAHVPQASGGGATTGPQPASPGIAIGPVRRPTSTPIDLAGIVVGDPGQERQRLSEGILSVQRDIESVRTTTAHTLGDDEANIFDAHLTLLGDSELLADIDQLIDSGVGAATAWADCLADVEREWAGLPDPYLRERAGDVRAVADQVLRRLVGAPTSSMVSAGVLVARDLTPSEAAALDPDLVLGVVLAEGSPSSHAAILARALDIPVVVGAGPDVLRVPDGTTVILDGATGELYIDPPPGLVHEFTRQSEALANRRALHLASAQEPAVSRDGVTVSVGANLGSVADATAALAAGADSAGLVRTEILFLDRALAPDTHEQQAAYDAIAIGIGGRRVTVRTLDVGGDKPIAYLRTPVEQNPFLGQRGIRLSLDHRDLLREQLVAICATARRFPTSVMFPMVSTLTELLSARQILTEAAGPSGLPEDLRVGMMVEVPAAALKIESFLPHLDFVSIGTNDLTQYTLAAERGNGAVAALSDALDPGVLQLIDHVSRAARGRIPVSVCGEAASDELAVPVLVGLGIRHLSVTPSAVPRVKASIRELDLERCTRIAQCALTLAGPEDVRRVVLAELAQSAVQSAEPDLLRGSGALTQLAP